MLILAIPSFSYMADVIPVQEVTKNLKGQELVHLISVYKIPL